MSPVLLDAILFSIVSVIGAAAVVALLVRLDDRRDQDVREPLRSQREAVLETAPPVLPLDSRWLATYVLGACVAGTAREHEVDRLAALVGRQAGVISETIRRIQRLQLLDADLEHRAVELLHALHRRNGATGGGDEPKATGEA